MSKKGNDISEDFVNEIVAEVLQQTGVDAREAVHAVLNGRGYHPDYLNGLILAEAAKVPGVHDSTLLRLAEKANYNVCHAFREVKERRGSLSDPILEALMGSDDENVRHSMLLTGSVPDSIIAKFYPKEKSAHIRAFMLAQIKDPTVVSKAVKDKSVSVRTAAARHSLLAREDALTLARDKNKTVVIALSRATKDPEVQREIIKSPHPNAQYYLATNHDLESGVVRDLAAVCDQGAARVLLRGYGDQYPDIVDVIMERTDDRDYRVIEAVVALPALGLERRAEITVNSRSTRVRKWFFDSLNLVELQTLVESEDKRVREFASKQLVKKAFF